MRFEERVRCRAGDMKGNVPCLIKDAFWSVESCLISGRPGETGAQRREDSRTLASSLMANQLFLKEVTGVRVKTCFYLFI